MSDLQPELLAWTALLGRWIDLVKAGAGMPEAGDGDHWQKSIPSIIELQATAFALGDLESLESADRPLARDRATLLVEGAAERLETIWAEQGIPPELREIQDAASIALSKAIYAGLRWLRWNGPGTWVVPEISLPQVEGTLAMMQPGTIALPGEPVAWFTERASPLSCEELETVPGEPVQVQRVIEDHRIQHDLLTDLDHEIVGVPLLVPLSLAGEAIGHFTVESDVWRQAQEEAMGEMLPALIDARFGE
jgi:hypothetical protein